MADNIQPTILVKKTDGTTERITLAELKNRQASQIKEKPALITDLKLEKGEHLLDEKVPDSEHAKTSLAATRTDQVSKIIDSLSFKVAVSTENRLRSVIQLRLKDIRGEADTLDACTRSIKDGGLGLTEPQAQELTKKSQPTTYVPKTELQKKVSSQVVDNILQVSAPIAPIEDLIKQSAASVKENKMPLRPSLSISNKIPIHDVKTSSQAVGPLQEIEIFSLVDFRRLSNKAVEAANRLKQKFINLKEESYLLYMNSWRAWRQSPLCQSYVSAVDMALSQKRPLVSVLGEKDKINLAEIEALITMEKELGI